MKWLSSLEEAAEKVVLRLFPRLLESNIAVLYPHGKIARLDADGRFCDLYVNHADIIEGVNAVTKDIPVMPSIVGTLAVGDEVLLVRTGRTSASLMVMTKKQIR